MRLGAIFPHDEVGADPRTVREYARTAEAAGYGHLLSYDHVLGANPDRPGGWDGPYDYEDPFHEPLTLFAHLAAVTDDLRFFTGILILPQRQTALVAKQTAEVDVLSGGRLEVGVGVGWNEVEYEALGQDFRVRGARVEEQLDLLEELWTNELVEFAGRFHHVPDAGLNPLPVQRPIPVWIGGGADVVLRRAARKGDGWMPPGKWRQPDQPLDPLEGHIESLHEYLREEGRDPAGFRLLGRMTLGSEDRDRWVERARRWRDLGATHLSVDTGSLPLDTPEEHADLLGEFHDVMADAGLDGPE